MKFFRILTIYLTLFIQASLAQQQAANFTGTYSSSLDRTTNIIIRNADNGLIVEIERQGRLRAKNIGADKFRLVGVRPKATLEFKRSSDGQISGFKWIQQLPEFSFVRMESSKADTSGGRLSRFVGNYRLSINRTLMMRVRMHDNQLTAQFINEGVLMLTQVSDTRFVIVDGDLTLTFDFVVDKNGKITSINFSRNGSAHFSKTADDTSYDIYGFKRRGRFTRADSLRGMLTSLRTCYDVLFYDLDVAVDPVHRTISGINKIRFKAMTAFDRMQVDLFASMKIEKVLFRDKALSFTRELHAVFIDLPATLQKGTVDEIDIIYAGEPQTPNPSILAGGIFWLWDKNGEDWIETVTQGSGASLWWPCKDHLSDKPDSMRISVTVPKGLTDISNGKLVSVKELPNDQTRFEWYVHNPITTYCVALNIGAYVHLEDQYIREGDTLHLHYYSKPYDVEVGQKLFRQVKPMLTTFEKYFGKYPFATDDFTILESIYPMEHQNAVTFGPIFNPFYSDKYDMMDVRQTMWHEVAHEWWGNHITIKDFADLWIHESFATYAEVLAYESIDSKAAAAKYLRNQNPSNKEAIIGTYDVNDFRLGDMYSKGALMLHTLRNVINNDSVWFDLLRSIQAHFSFQCINTEQLIGYINKHLNSDLTYFFDQYLRYPSIPKLEWKIEKQMLTYRWKADVSDFRMPVKVTVEPSLYTFIYPTTKWQTMDVSVKERDFRIDKDNFYVE